MSRQAFIDGHLGRGALQSAKPVDPTLLAQLPGIGDVPRLAPLVAEHGTSLRYGRAGDPSASPAPRFPDGRIDMEALWSDYYNGASIVLNSLHKADEGSRDICDRLFCELGHRLQANAYLTPPAASAFPTHYDTHDVIVVQMSGRKTWHLYDPGATVPPLPLRSDARIDASLLEQNAHREIELTEGMALYLPRGIPHRAETRAGASFHITFGLVPVTAAELIKTAVDILESSDVRLRQQASPDIFLDPAAHFDLAALLDGLSAALRRPGLAAQAIERVRKQAFKDAQMNPPIFFELAEGAPERVRWRSGVFSETRGLPDGSLLVTNGIKATRIAGEERAGFERLAGAGAAGIATPEECSAAMIRRLSALGLVEPALREPR